MSNTKNTKAFFNTEIPRDWEVKELGEIGELKNGVNKEKEDFGFGFPMVNLMDVFGINKVYKNNFQLGLVNATERDIKEYSLRKGDVLFIRSSVKPEGVGLTTVICDDLENTTYSGFIIRFRDNGFLDLEYKAHCFFEEGFRRRLLNKSTISANTNINQGALNSLQLPLPPLPEQKAIAQVLCTADAAIHTTEKIIAQKELRKKWLMQQLLTGKKRLMGFSGEWKNVKLAEYTKKVKGKVFEVSDDKTGLPCITASSFNGKYTDFTNNTEAVKCEMNDVLILWDGENAGAVTTGHEGIVGSTVAKLILKKGLVNFFIANHMQYFNGRLRGIREGSGIPHMPGDFEDWYTFQMPSLEEQTAIAQVLQAADKEISLLKAKAEKLREQKKGLMQQLLTGKVRLKINNERK
jgi:type I restriction enzyme S subunit